MAVGTATARSTWGRRPSSSATTRVSVSGGKWSVTKFPRSGLRHLAPVRIVCARSASSSAVRMLGSARCRSTCEDMSRVFPGRSSSRRSTEEHRRSRRRYSAGHLPNSTSTTPGSSADGALESGADPRWGSGEPHVPILHAGHGHPLLFRVRPFHPPAGMSPPPDGSPPCLSSEHLVRPRAIAHVSRRHACDAAAFLVLRSSAI